MKLSSCRMRIGRVVLFLGFLVWSYGAFAQFNSQVSYEVPKGGFSDTLSKMSEPSFFSIDPYSEVDRFYMIESLNDSLDIVTHMDDFDEEEFSPSVYMDDYESFDNLVIHYPRTNFSKKTDTTLLPLLYTAGQKFSVPHQGPVTSVFGPRKRRYHYGVDLKLYTGDTVRATFDGVVRISMRNSSYGYLVIVRHYNGLETYYAHLSRLLVECEQVVKAGEAIGLGGNTGRSTGAHLHFEVRYLGTPLDPQLAIDFDEKALKQDTLMITRQTFPYQSHRFHKVRSGETLSSIARKYGTSVSKLQSLNRMRSTSLRAGATIRVY